MSEIKTDELLTPLNHREIEYNAGKLSGIDIPGSFIYESSEAKELFNWLDMTGNKVFDDDLIMDYGTDCLRLYLLFEHTPRENDAPFYESWNEGALEGMYKFLGRYRRVMLAALLCDAQGGYSKLPDENIQTMKSAFESAQLKIDKYIKRGNDMSDRHNIVASLMELLNILQRELKTGEVVKNVRQHAVALAHPYIADGDNPVNLSCINNSLSNRAVMQICRDFIILMSPIAYNLSKILWLELV